MCEPPPPITSEASALGATYNERPWSRPPIRSGSQTARSPGGVEGEPPEAPSPLFKGAYSLGANSNGPDIRASKDPSTPPGEWVATDSDPLVFLGGVAGEPQDTVCPSQGV